MAEAYPVGVGAQHGGQLSLELDRHVAQADGAVSGVQQGAGDDADGVGEVDDPGAGLGPAPYLLGYVEYHRHGAQGLGEAAGTGGLLAEQAEVVRQGLVDQSGRLAAHAQLDEDGGGAVHRLGQVFGGQPAGVAVSGEDAAGQAADDVQALGVDVVQDEFVDRQHVGAPGEAFDQFGCVGAATADNGDFHSCSQVRCGGSALDAGQRDALDEDLLREEEQHQDGQQEQQRGRHLQLVGVLVSVLGELAEGDGEVCPVSLLPV